jgi:hypothetical protein
MARGSLMTGYLVTACLLCSGQNATTSAPSAEESGQRIAKLASGFKPIRERIEAMAEAVALYPRSTGAAAIVAYTVDKSGWHGPGATSFRLRAYETRGGRLVLTDSTGGDFDGYASLAVKQLTSTDPGSDAWFIVSGRLTGANGPNTRMRGYRYEAGKFHTMWMPADAWGDFTIRVTQGGFTVDGDYYREDDHRHEVYHVGYGQIQLQRSSKPKRTTAR